MSEITWSQRSKKVNDFLTQERGKGLEARYLNKTPRNCNLKIKQKLYAPAMINNLVEKKVQNLSNVFRAPSTQKSDKNYRSSFSLYASNGSIIRNEASGCNIPRPLRYSFRNSDSKSNIIDSVRKETSSHLNTYSDQNMMTSMQADFTPLSDYEELKAELQQRNVTILNLQSEIKDLKLKHQTEMERLLSKSTSSEYQE